MELPFILWRVSAGFPSPAGDYEERPLDLTDLVVAHPASTFFVRVEGNSMNGASIFDGDLVVVDRALPARNNAIIIAELHGGLTLKRLKIEQDRQWLVADNPLFLPIEITPAMHFRVWGVVTYVLHQVR